MKWFWTVCQLVEYSCVIKQLVISRSAHAALTETDSYYRVNYLLDLSVLSAAQGRPRAEKRKETSGYGHGPTFTRVQVYDYRHGPTFTVCKSMTTGMDRHLQCASP